MFEVRDIALGPDDAQLRLATALVAAESHDAVGRAVTEWAASAAEAAFANLALFGEDRHVLQVRHGGALESLVAERWSEIPLDVPTPLCDAVLGGEPVLLGNLNDYRHRYRGLIEDTVTAGLQATSSMPLQSRDGATLGAIGLGWYEPQSFSPRQLSRLRLIAELVAQALERVTSVSRGPLALGRAASRALQEAFLPSVPANTENLQTAAAYLPASDAPMGGDWFDVFPVEAGTCLVIGDIGGHGTRAAALMAEVRSAIRGFAVDDPSPASVVSRTNRMLCKLHPDSTATLIVAVWDPTQNIWLRSNAGHPPALRCRRDESSYLLPTDARGPMLGCEPHWKYQQEPTELRAGTTLLLYTDGLIEDGHQDISIGMEHLRLHAEALPDLTPQALVDDILLWRLSRGRCPDDLCLLAVRLT